MLTEELQTVHHLCQTLNLKTNCDFASIVGLQALARQVLTHGKDIAVLSEELPHVMSSKLKISWQEAADMLEQVCYFLCSCELNHFKLCRFRLHHSRSAASLNRQLLIQLPCFIPSLNILLTNFSLH